MTDQTIPADAVREAVTTPEVGLGDRVTFEACGRRVLGTVTRCDKDGITIREESPYALSAAAPEPQSATTPKDTPMTDQMIPADKVRAVLDDPAMSAADVVEVIRELLPAPPRPTLAELTDEERAACLRMQCDTAPNRSVRGFIADIYPGGCRVIERDTWEWRSCSDDMVTPRPDLPRMAWPGDKKSAPALPGDWRLADHKDYGRVIVTNLTPNAVGHVAYVLPATDPLGYDWFFCDPSELTYIDTGQGADQ